MSEVVPQAEINAAQAYETLMVPALFRPWAAIVAGAAQITPGNRVLDVACGTGILARVAAARVGAGGVVAGVDPSAAMLEIAKRCAPELDWHHGFAEALPFPGHSFDNVVSQFGLMFFQDRVAALQETLRVLRPGGRLAIAVWNSIENIPAYAAEQALLDRTAGRQAAAALAAPFALGALDDLTTLFRAAGVANVATSTQHATANFPSVKVMMEADLRGWLPMAGVVLSEEEIAHILEEAEIVFDPYVGEDGTMRFEVSAHVVTGTND